jgi:hypothetical protein
MAHADVGAQKAAEAVEKRLAEKVQQAREKIRKAVDIMDEVQGVFDRATKEGRYINRTVVEAVKKQATAIKHQREDVEGLLTQSGTGETLLFINNGEEDQYIPPR